MRRENTKLSNRPKSFPHWFRMGVGSSVRGSMYNIPYSRTMLKKQKYRHTTHTHTHLLAATLYTNILGFPQLHCVPVVNKLNGECQTLVERGAEHHPTEMKYIHILLDFIYTLIRDILHESLHLYNQNWHGYSVTRQLLFHSKFSITNSPHIRH